MPESVVAAVARLVDELPGLPVWRARVGWGSFVTLDMGGVYITSAGSRGGQFHLWVYGARWMLEERGQTLAHSEDRRRVMEDAVRRLSHRTVISINVDVSSPEMTISFDGGMILLLAASNEPGMEEWMFFFDDETVLKAVPELVINIASAPRSSW